MCLNRRSICVLVAAFPACFVSGASFRSLPLVRLMNDELPDTKSDTNGNDGLVELVDSAYPYETTWDPRDKPISDEDRIRIEKANGAKKSSCSMGTATYGETEPEGQVAVLKAIGAKPGQRYYDLGAGLGRNVLVAWLLGMEATGVELSHEMFAYSCKRVGNVSAHSAGAEAVLTKARRGGRPLRLVEADVALYDFSDADVVFMNDKCWSESLIHKLDSSLAGLHQGAKVISHKELQVKGLSFTKTVHAWMSWTLEPMAFNVYTAQGTKTSMSQSAASNSKKSSSEGSCGILHDGKRSA